MRQIFSWLLALISAFLAWELLASQLIRRAAPLVPLGDTAARVRPGLTVASDEGYTRAVFTNEGYRKPTPPKDLRPRILVLGDSYAEALQVSSGNDMSSILADSLEKEGVKAGVWNAGASGRTPAHYLALAPHYQKTLQPDLVVIQFSQSDFTKDLDTPADGFGFSEEASGWKLVVPEKAPKSGLVDLLMRSSVLYISGSRVAENRRTGGHGGGQKEKKTEEELAAERNEKAAKVRRFTQWLIPQLHAAYPQLAIVYIPVYEYFDKDAKPAPEEEALLLACQKAGVPFVNGRSLFRERFELTGEPSHGFSNTTPGAGHINGIGHRLLGQELARVLGPGLASK